MNSSTSSSRRLYAKTLLIILLGMGAGMLLIRGVAEIFDARAETILGRVMEARQALPQIVAEEDDLVMFFGSSMTEAGFSPRQFDRALEERGATVKSFNFGFGGLNPYFQDFLARRIRDAFEAQDRRLELALVEFTPFQVTGARYRRALPAMDSFVTMLASDRELFEMVPADPTRGIRMLNIRYFRNNISAEMATSAFSGPWRGGRPDSGLPSDEQADAKRQELAEKINAAFDRDYPDYVDSEWNYAWQGAGTIPTERSAEVVALVNEYYANTRTEKRLTDDRLWRIECCDIEEMHFEEALVQGFIRTVQNFQAFSDQVEIVLLPRNEDWIRYGPEAQARLDAVLERVRSETGAPIRNFQQIPGVTPESFSDTTHLTRYEGAVALTEHLVSVYAERLAAVAPSR